MERTPHPEDPAEGAPGVGEPDEESSADDEHGAPLGGDQGTEDQLDADNPTERDTLKTLDPDDSPA